MLDRASTFADSGIVKMLQEDFVPVAIDQAYQRRQQDTEGDFYRQIAGQGPRSDFQNTTQGFYIATPTAKLLLYNNNRHPEKVRRLMKEKLQQFQELEEAVQPTTAVVVERRDPRWDLKPPNNGLVLRVHGKVLGGYPPTDDPWKKIFQNAVSRDNMWISEAEHRRLVKGELPPTVSKRLVRFHLMDGTRGEPLMWKATEVRDLQLELEQGTLRGTVHLESEDGVRGYRAELRGFVETEREQITRFDVVAIGECWGDGPYTRGGPPGRFPLALSFELADGTDLADQVPPQGCKGWLQGYMAP